MTALLSALLSVPETPAFVYDEGAILEALQRLAPVRALAGGRLLYSVKALPLTGLLDLIQPAVDGFAASSLFEARLAHEAMARGAGQGALHITTPGLRAEEIGELARRCSHISFNSLEQYRRLAASIEDAASLGLRVNPGLSFLDDPRHDPCRPFSKLGVPLGEAAAALAAERALEGLHFHTQFECRSLTPLRATLGRLESALGRVLRRLRWINLGGGYLLDSAALVRELAELVAGLRERYGLEVFFEPGKAIVGAAGYLVTEVIDRFERGGKTIAVLDSGVQHLPAVFEYQKSPALAGPGADGALPCLLVGSTCLAGDVFGEYRFRRLPSVGERLVFWDVGAYTLTRASRFNGYDWPAIHALRRDGRIEPVKRYGYAAYRSQWQTEGTPLVGGGGDR